MAKKLRFYIVSAVLKFDVIFNYEIVCNFFKKTRAQIILVTYFCISVGSKIVAMLLLCDFYKRHSGILALFIIIMLQGIA